MTDNRNVSKLPDTSDSLPHAAVQYALLGFRVIPLNSVSQGLCSCRHGNRHNTQCSAPGKHPRIRQWQTRATTDLAEIDAWWKQWPDSNIGLPMGGEARLVALDIDGPKGRDSLANLEAQHELLPLTLTSRSGREDGGEHRLFRVPDGFDISAISNRVNVAPGLDIRAEGGQIVVAPSMHASGKRYEWTQKQAPAPLPRWLYTLIARKQHRPKYKRDFTRPSHLHPYGWGALVKGSNTVAAAVPGTRNDTLNSEAYCLGQLVAGGVLDRLLVEQHLTEAALHTGLKEQEIQRTLRSGLEDGLKEPRGVPERSRRTHKPTRSTDNSLPEVFLKGTLHQQVLQVFEAVQQHNDPPFLFKRNRDLVRIVSSTDQNIIEELTPGKLRALLQRRMSFKQAKRGEDEPVPTNPPIALMNQVIDQDTWPFPELQHLIQAPVFIPPKADLADTDGYYPKLQAYMNLNGFKPKTGMSLSKAKQLLDEWLYDFPFADKASRTHAFAFALTLLLRPLIKGNIPLFLVSAPVPGTGKSLLVQTLCSVVTGLDAATMTEAKDGDEWRKRITSVLQNSPPVVMLDNINRKLNSDALASVITSPIWQDRRLGQTQMLQVRNNAVWVVTANNPTMSGELARRCIWIHMDPMAEKPWTRTNFLHPLPMWGVEHRAELFGALVAVIQAWKQAGRPLAAPALGSFESWSSILGGVLHAAGFEGFLSNLEALWAWNDTETRDWRAFVDAWWTRFQSMPVGVSDLHQLAAEQDLLASVLGDGGERSQRTRLGKALGKRIDRVFGQHVIRRNVKGKVAVYRLTRM